MRNDGSLQRVMEAHYDEFIVRTIFISSLFFASAIFQERTFFFRSLIAASLKTLGFFRSFSRRRSSQPAFAFISLFFSFIFIYALMKNADRTRHRRHRGRRAQLGPATDSVLEY
jgi:hypothetical protein